MARYTKEHKASSHEKILKTAATLFKKKGYEGTGLKEVMEDAGLTVGTFYAHFHSKAGLLTETFIRAWEESKERLTKGLENAEKKEWLKSVVERYISREHSDSVETGCAFPALISEISRAPKETKQEIEDYFLDSIKKMSEKMPEAPDIEPQERTLATFCLMVGAISLSRAMVSQEISDQILNAAKKMALYDDKP